MRFWTVFWSILWEVSQCEWFELGIDLHSHCFSPPGRLGPDGLTTPKVVVVGSNHEYAPVAIREQLASTLQLDVGRVSVKFKTAEGVGPVGEGRSAEAQAIVTVVAGVE